jgi:hypothetical protein
LLIGSTSHLAYALEIIDTNSPPTEAHGHACARGEFMVPGWNVRAVFHGIIKPPKTCTGFD